MTAVISAQLPRGEALFKHQPGSLCVGLEVLGGIAAVQAESHHQASGRGQMPGEVGQRRHSLGLGKERHHVAGTYRQVELPERPVRVTQLEIGQVAYLPLRLGVVGAGHLDQMRVQIHPGHLVPALAQPAANASGAAAGIQNPAAPLGHGINQPGFPIDVFALLLKIPPALREILRMLGVVAHGGKPGVFFRSSHVSSVARTATL